MKEKNNKTVAHVTFVYTLDLVPTLFTAVVNIQIEENCNQPYSLFESSFNSGSWYG